MQDFLSTLYGDGLADSQRVLVFSLPAARGRHFSAIAAAALYAGKQAETQDVYFGVGLAGSSFGHKNCATDIVAVPGVWADIDLAAPWRNSKPLPQTLGDAWAILDALPFPPSLLVDSGHGIHAYWLFKELWEFETDAERLEAAAVVKGWIDLIRETARKMGWEVDPVGDLSRILRLPGTWNRKADPVEVRVLEHHEGRRYNPDAFAPFAA